MDSEYPNIAGQTMKENFGCVTLLQEKIEEQPELTD